jgi:hypothetical protein
LPDDSEKRRFRWNFKFRAECPSIQPRMKLPKIHAFPRYIDPRIRNSHAADQIPLNEMSRRDDPPTAEAISGSVMPRNTLGNGDMPRTNHGVAAEMEETSPSRVLSATSVDDVGSPLTDDAGKARERPKAVPRTHLFHTYPRGASFQMSRELAGLSTQNKDFMSALTQPACFADEPVLLAAPIRAAIGHQHLKRRLSGREGRTTHFVH